MEFLEPWIAHLAALAGLLGGIVFTWFLCRTKASIQTARYEERSKAAKKAIVDLEAACANLEADTRQLRHSEAVSLKRQSELEMLVHSQQRIVEEKQQLLREAEFRMSQNFKALSAEALRTTQEEFLQLARSTFDSQQKEATSELEQRRIAVETLVRPVAATLNKVESRIVDLEQARQHAEAALNEQVRQMASAQLGLQKETASLAQALRQPVARGRWGEMQLKRVVELAGMQEHCDFVSPTGPNGKNGSGPQHPDLIVNLPTGRKIAIDSRAPLEAFLAAAEAEDETKRSEALERHAEQVAAHLAELASPAYRAQFQVAPEFTVLFLPSESIFSAALAEQPALVEKGVEQGVILATPTTLIALLRAAAAGWRQEDIAAKARTVSKVGRELYSRVSTLANHVAQVGQSLDATVRNYNLTLGSLEGSVLPGARQLGELAGTPSSESLPAVPVLERAVRPSRHSAPAQAQAETETDLSHLPLSRDLDSMAATGEIPDQAFEGFTDPVSNPNAAPQYSGARNRIARTKVRLKSNRQPDPVAAEQPASGAAQDPGAALGEQKKAG